MHITRLAAPSTHAFAYYDVKCLDIISFSYISFLSKLRECLFALGYASDSYAGHSFRGGSASFAFQIGIPVELIKMVGYWKSDSALLYLTVPPSHHSNDF